MSKLMKQSSVISEDIKQTLITQKKMKEQSIVELSKKFSSIKFDTQLSMKEEPLAQNSTDH